MAILLEIGGGKHPGPRFEDVDQHISVDIDTTAVENASRLHPDITSQFGDAEQLTDFSDSSVDTVLARNVFGDPLLGFSGQSRHLAAEDLARKREQGEAYRIVKENKLRILASAARVLIDGGRLIIVEQLTPEIAEAFLGHHAKEIPTGLQIEQADFDSVAPKNYVYSHTMTTSPVVYLGRNSK